MATEIVTAPTPSAESVASRAASTTVKVGANGDLPSYPSRGTKPSAPPAPASTTTTNTVPIASPVTTDPPKPGSGLAKLNEKLRKKAGVEEAPVADPNKPTDTPPADKPADAPTVKPGEATPVTDDGKKGKTNPWKLVEENKAKVKELETKLSESEKRAVPETKWKEMETQLADQKKRNDELEAQLRLTDYAKSNEFQEKYQKPYDAAWERAMSDLDGLTVSDSEGNERPVSAQDILSLVNEPDLRKAMATAKELFGEDLAAHVMSHRNDIRKLYKEQAQAIENAKKTAGEHSESQKKASEAVRAEISQEWNTVNEAAKADPAVGKYFSQKEGDAEGNQRLAKGYELVDRAFSENPQAPGLTTEQRKAIIQRHAVVRNRAAAFGRLRGWLEASETRVAALEKELAEYKGTEPETKGGGRETTQTEEKGIRRIMKRLEAKAIPA